MRIGNVSKAVTTLPRVEHRGRQEDHMIGVSYKSGDPKLAFGVMDKLAVCTWKALTVHRPTFVRLLRKRNRKYRQALADSEAHLSEFSARRRALSPPISSARI